MDQKSLELYQRLANYAGEDRMVRVLDLMDEWANKEDDAVRIESGMEPLDFRTDGFRTGEVWVVSGPTKHGKTLLCDTIGANMAKAGEKVAWFSFEVQTRRLMEKYRALGAMNLHTPRVLKAGDLGWLFERIMEAKIKYDCRVFFIDHLHFVVDPERLARHRDLEIGRVMRLLKQKVAIAQNVLVFLISHIAKVKLESLVDETDLRDSSFTAQEADGVIMVQRMMREGATAADDEPFDGDKAKVTVCNARYSGTMRSRFNVRKVGPFLYDDLIAEQISPEGPVPAYKPKRGKTKDELAKLFGT